MCPGPCLPIVYRGLFETAFDFCRADAAFSFDWEVFTNFDLVVRGAEPVGFERGAPAAESNASGADAACRTGGLGVREARRFFGFGGGTPPLAS